MLPKMLPMYQRVKYLTFLLVENFSLNPLITSLKVNTQPSIGGVAEWLNAPVLKTDVGESLPWVRIPPPPPYAFIKLRYNNTLREQGLTISPILSPNRFKRRNSLQKFRLPSKIYTISLELYVYFPVS